jgi:hypothetical protein
VSGHSGDSVLGRGECGDQCGAEEMRHNVVPPKKPFQMAKMLKDNTI